MSQEHQFSPREREIAFLGIAHKFTGINFPYNAQGLRAATAALRSQHEKIMPPTHTRVQLLQIVAQQDPIIRTTEQMAAIALEEDDYEAALSTANHLHAYGEINCKDSLGGEAFDLSLRTHRALAEKIRDRFSASDSYLRFAGTKMFAEIEENRQKDNFVRELELLRGLIHMTAINGTLGEKAKQQFDPFAIVQIE